MFQCSHGPGRHWGTQGQDERDLLNFLTGKYFLSFFTLSMTLPCCEPVVFLFSLFCLFISLVLSCCCEPGPGCVTFVGLENHLVITSTRFTVLVSLCLTQPTVFKTSSQNQRKVCGMAWPEELAKSLVLPQLQ